MYRIDSDGSVGALPTPAALGSEGFWSKGDPLSAQAPTVEDQDWFNAVQENLIAFLTASGLPHSKTDYSRVWQAVLKCQSFQDAGSANHIVINLPAGLAFPSGSVGFGTTVRVKMAATNTGATDLGLFGLAAAPVVLPGGSPLVGDELGAGCLYEFVNNGTGAWQILSLLSRPQLSNFIILTPGSGNVTIPAEYFEVEGWGGGGATMGSSIGVPVCGGGGGAYFWKRYFVRGTYSYSVGAGGIATAYGVRAGGGGTTSFNGGAQLAGGGGGSDQGFLGIAGSASGGEINLSGAGGSAAVPGADVGGSGGASARGTGGPGSGTGIALPGVIPGSGAAGPGSSGAGFAGQPGGAGRIFIRY